MGFFQYIPREEETLAGYPQAEQSLTNKKDNIFWMNYYQLYGVKPQKNR